MKTRLSTFLLLCVCIFFQSCESLQEIERTHTQVKLDSLDRKIRDQAAYLNFIKQQNPNIITRNLEGGYCTIFLFEPFGLDIQLENTRPEYNEKNFLSIPAAYTSKTLTIDGLFINKGKEINNRSNPLLNGFCIINKDSISILDFNEVTEPKITKIIKSQSSAFQQTLLINEGKIVECKLFGNTESFRRALIKFEDMVAIGESHRPITINEFQQSLKNIGAVSAVNLDMGSWSEGWLKTHSGQKRIIGDNRNNTPNQTSWLVYKMVR